MASRSRPDDAGPDRPTPPLDRGPAGAAAGSPASRRGVPGALGSLDDAFTKPKVGGGGLFQATKLPTILTYHSYHPSFSAFNFLVSQRCAAPGRRRVPRPLMICRGASATRRLTERSRKTCISVGVPLVPKKVNKFIRKWVHRSHMTYSYYQKKEASRDRRPSGSVARATAAQRVAAVRSGAQAARCRPESGRRQLLLRQKQRVTERHRGGRVRSRRYR